MNKQMVDLREHLFSTIESLLSGDKTMDVDKARAIAEVGRVLVDSARAENELLGLVKRNPYTLEIKGTGFLTLEPAEHLLRTPPSHLPQ